MLRELQRLDESLDSYRRAIELKPDYAEAFSNRGIALKELKRLDEALDSYDRAIALNPDVAEAYSNRGFALHELHGSMKRWTATTAPWSLSRTLRRLAPIAATC